MRKNNWTAFGLLLSLSLLAHSTAKAADSGDLFMTPILGGLSFSKDQGLETGTSIGLRFGLSFLSKENVTGENVESSDKWITSRWGIEGGIEKVSTKRKSDQKHLNATLWDISALYHLMKMPDRWYPFFKVGAGGITIESIGNDPMLRYGVGMRYLLVEKRVALQADIQHILDFNSEKMLSHFEATLGIRFIAPKVIQKVVKLPPPDSDLDKVLDLDDRCPNTALGEIVDQTGCPLDQDRDGISDRLDLCPMTPAKMTIDKNGCTLDIDFDKIPDQFDQCLKTPIGIAVDEFGCSLDADLDRIPDTLDQCPNTPGKIAVNTVGCPLDTDSDRIPDSLDQCPNNPIGIVIDGSGCPVDTDADKVPDILDKCPTVYGTDSVGCPLDTDSDGILDAFDICPETHKDQPVNPFGCPKLGE
ncbi:MAG: thrombospondin type 3 repeat-containing protein [Nitrospirota bacterium]